jgi:hypothetical protein
MCTGGEYRGVRHDLHFSAASSFHIGVSRGRRMQSSGMLASVLHRWHRTCSAHQVVPGYIPQQDWQNAVQQDPLSDYFGPMQKPAPQQPAPTSGF